MLWSFVLSEPQDCRSVKLHCCHAHTPHSCQSHPGRFLPAGWGFPGNTMCDPPVGISSQTFLSRATEQTWQQHADSAQFSSSHWYSTDTPCRIYLTILRQFVSISVLAATSTKTLVPLSWQTKLIVSFKSPFKPTHYCLFVVFSVYDTRLMTSL